MALDRAPRPASLHPGFCRNPLWLPRLHLRPLRSGRSFLTVLPTVSYHSFLPRDKIHYPHPPHRPGRPHLAALTLWEQLQESVRQGWLGWEVERRGRWTQQRAPHRCQYGSELEGRRPAQPGWSRGWAEGLRVSEVGRREPQLVLERGRPWEGIT